MNSVGRASHAIGNNTSPNEEIRGEGGGGEQYIFFKTEIVC